MNKRLRAGEIRADDGRNIDPSVGSLEGYGALQRFDSAERDSLAQHRGAIERSAAAAGTEGPSYYGMPLLKEPVWKWYIPVYFYVGGVSGGCAVLGAAADLFGGAAMRPLSRQCRLVAAVGAASSAALLIADLGRPARFLNMLRVFRPTSPMNMGTWILTAFGGCASLAAAAAVRPERRSLRPLGDAAAVASGLIGLPLTGYTGVLLTDTAVPLWQGARRSLPILFSAFGVAAAASLLEMTVQQQPSSRAVHRWGVAAKATELLMTFALEREVARAPRVARPLRRGLSGALWTAARALTATSLLLAIAGHRRSAFRRTAALLGSAGALALRFALVEAGRASARDPHAAFEQQRAGLGVGELARPQSSLRRPSEERSGTGAEAGFHLTDRAVHGHDIKEGTKS